jgi:hypothetical protein
MSTTSIGGALCMVRKTLARVSYGWTKGARAAIWGTSSSDASAVSRAAYMKPRSLK